MNEFFKETKTQEGALIATLYRVRQAGGDPFSNPDFQAWRRSEEVRAAGSQSALADLNRREVEILAQAGFTAEAKALLDVIARQEGGRTPARRLRSKSRLLMRLPIFATT